jgi:hypothetical protein
MTDGEAPIVLRSKLEFLTAIDAREERARAFIDPHPDLQPSARLMRVVAGQVYEEERMKVQVWIDHLAAKVAFYEATRAESVLEEGRKLP